MHWLTYKHPFAEESKEIASIGNIDIGYAPGGLTTVIQSSYGFWNPFIMRVGPSMRSVADMKTDVLYAALPTGNSGNMFSLHYRDMVEIFQRGELIEISLTRIDPAWIKLTPPLRPNPTQPRPATTGPRRPLPLYFARFAAFRLVFEVFVMEEVLFSRCEYKVCSAINALEDAVLEFRHYCSPLST